MLSTTGRVLILGATGRFGRHAAEAFWNRGWQVRCFDRARDDIRTAARGVDLIVNGWNPPYPLWARQVPELTRQVIAAAQASGATVLLPGNVYVYGAGAPPVLTAATPHRATNPLGRIRIEMEAAYRSAGVPVILLRAGDFLDTEASGNWFDLVIAKRIARGRLDWPGRSDAPHAWAYLPDLARAAVLLAERRALLPRYAEVLFPGHTLSGTEIRDIAAAVTGRPVTLRPMPWWPLRLAGTVAAMPRCLCEMRYLWDMPHRLDGAGFREFLPDFAATPAETAIASALAPKLHPDEPVAREAERLAV